jgi:hypothetical protein
MAGLFKFLHCLFQRKICIFTISKGLPKQALEMAKNKTQDIQSAYELIKEKRGFK